MSLTIHRGSHQIGGCCTELTCNGERVLIDLGANLSDSDTPIQDDGLVSKVFDGCPAAGLLFTHPHGDHYGLYQRVPEDVSMYIGPMAKEILKVLVSRLDYISEEKGLPVVERMRTYQAGKELGEKAETLFQKHKYNFVQVSSTNLDSIMEFFHYTMWDGYIKPEHADRALIDFISGRPIEPLHTSGHAYVETIAKLIETVDPKVIVPMHTERAEEFASIPEFASCKDRVRVLQDGQALSLDEL